MTVYIQLTIAGSDSGPFNLYSDIDAFSSAFEINIDKNTLIGGYASSLVPDGTNIIRVLSTGLCTNFIDIVISPTTTSTTTIPPCYCVEVLYTGESSADFTYIDCYGESQSVTISTPSEKYCGSEFLTESSDITFNYVGDICIFNEIDYECPVTTTTTTTIGCICTQVTYIGESSADFTYVDCYGVPQTETISSFGTTSWCGSTFLTDSPDISFNVTGEICIFGGESYICPTTTTTTTIIL